jgi:Protein of unknown function (DUF2818)
MAASGLYLSFILAAFFAANIPWLSERFLLVVTIRKSASLRWLEWLLLYVLIGILSVGLEYKVTGVRQAQDWEFYVVTLSLFMVFALPGFIYHYDLKKMLQRAKPE